MLTRQDKNYLKKTFATKKYLDDNFATKKYLDDNFVTKKEHEVFFNSTAEEFLSIHQQFRVIDKKFEQVDKRFEQVDKRFEQVDKRFDRLEDLINEVLLEVRSTNRKFDVTFNRVDDHDLRIAQLETKPRLSIL